MTQGVWYYVDPEGICHGYCQDEKPPIPQGWSEVDEPPSPPSNAPYQISKTTPWLRMTGPECETMDAVLMQTDAQLKNIYLAALYISTSDPNYHLIRSAFVDAFGEERANVILAPET